MKQLHVWTEEEVNVLKARYLTDGPTVLAAELGIGKVAVQRKAFHLGLTHRKPGERTTTEIAQLRKLHEEDRHKSRMLSPEARAQRRAIQLKYNTGLRAERRAQGLCIRCKQPTIEHSTSYCLFHWAAVCMGNTCRQWSKDFGIKLLAKLDEQNYRCALTGDLLIPGFNCSVDHIVPKSKGGAVADLDNLRWVTVDANRSKGDMTDEEFIAFCQRVINHSTNSGQTE